MIPWAYDILYMISFVCVPWYHGPNGPRHIWHHCVTYDIIVRNMISGGTKVPDGHRGRPVSHGPVKAQALQTRARVWPMWTWEHLPYYETGRGLNLPRTTKSISLPGPASSLRLPVAGAAGRAARQRRHAGARVVSDYEELWIRMRDRRATLANRCSSACQQLARALLYKVLPLVSICLPVSICLL